MNPVLRFLLATLASLVLFGAFVGIAVTTTMRTCLEGAGTPRAVRALARRPPDPMRPLVAIVLGNTSSDVTDVLGPYALFAESGVYDVRLVASSLGPRTLSGGLDVLPQATFADVAESAAMVVTPAIVDIAGEVNAPVRAFVARTHARDVQLFSWCTGAEVLAASGVANGRELTAHWGDLPRLEASYPRVRWVRGMRYVESSRLLSSGGLSSGIDATLHAIAERDGADVAERVRRSLGIPTSRFVSAPSMEAFAFDRADAIYFFDAAFYWPKRSAGVWLRDGVDELALLAYFDAYPASFVERASTIARHGIVVSRHGLTLVARTSGVNGLDRIVVPGGSGGEVPSAMRGALAARGVPIVGIPTSSRGPLVATLEGLAADEGTAVARFAAKRFEYRAGGLQLRGPRWRPRAFVVFMATVLLTLALVGSAMRAWSVRARAYAR